MKRQTPIAHLLYNYLYPHPTQNDPPSFSAHLARNLVPEVRIEVATFYGDLNSAEARYPGLNYCYAPHRMRLGRFKHHKRLFDAFDNLGLTYNEIQDFCCWEGTKWARERYEKDEGVKVVDTTGDEIGPFVDRRERIAEDLRRHSITRKTDISVIVEEAQTSHPRQPPIEEDDEEMDDVDSDGEPEPETTDASTETDREPPSEVMAREQHIAELEHRREQSIHQRINQHIIRAWEQGQTLPAEIEQYLKDQAERGNSELTRLLASRRGSHALSAPENTAVVATQASRAAA